MDPIIYIMLALPVACFIACLIAIAMLLIEDCRMPKSYKRRIQKKRYLKKVRRS